jgi:flagellar motor switch protein FliM
MNDILSQEEIDALKDAVSQGKVDTLEDTAPGAVPSETYDFVSRNRHLVSRLPGLKVIYSGFAGFSSSALTARLRRTVRVELTSVQQVTVEDLVRGGESLSCLCSVKHSAVKHPILFIMDSILLLSFIDAVCGGEGLPVTMEDREEMGPIEQKIVQSLPSEVVKSLEQAWQVVGPASLELQTIEYNPQIVSSLPRHEVVEVAVFQIGTEEVQGELTLALPHNLIEAVRGELLMEQQVGDEGGGQWAATLAYSVVRAEVDLKVELAQGRLNVRDFFNLKAGDVIYLEPHPEDKLIVAVEGIPKFFGMAGTVRNAQAVQITSRID